MARFYDGNGDPVTPEDVLTDDELEDYYRHPNRTVGVKHSGRIKDPWEEPEA